MSEVLVDGGLAFLKFTQLVLGQSLHFFGNSSGAGADGEAEIGLYDDVQEQSDTEAGDGPLDESDADGNIAVLFFPPFV